MVHACIEVYVRIFFSLYSKKCYSKRGSTKKKPIIHVTLKWNALTPCLYPANEVSVYENACKIFTISLKLDVNNNSIGYAFIIENEWLLSSIIFVDKDWHKTRAFELTGCLCNRRLPYTFKVFFKGLWEVRF